MLFYSSTLSSDKSRNSILFFRKDFVIQKVIVSEFNFGRHGRTVEYVKAWDKSRFILDQFLIHRQTKNKQVQLNQELSLAFTYSHRGKTTYLKITLINLILVLVLWASTVGPVPNFLTDLNSTPQNYSKTTY